MSGLKVFLYWETYVAILEYLAIYWVPLFIFAMVMEKKEKSESSLGCLIVILPPLLSLIAIAVFILTLAPIILGISTNAAWGFPWKVIMLAPWQFLKLIGMLILGGIVSAIIPIVNSFQTIFTLILGGICLIFILPVIGLLNPGLDLSKVALIPGFWFSIGLVIIGGVVSWMGVAVTALLVSVSVLLTGAGDINESDLGQLIMAPFGAIFGFIPVFMYGAWLGIQIKNAI